MPIQFICICTQSFVQWLPPPLCALQTPAHGGAGNAELRQRAAGPEPHQPHGRQELHEAGGYGGFPQQLQVSLSFRAISRFPFNIT